jgi:cytochrome c-type biogenesis protein
MDLWTLLVLPLGLGLLGFIEPCTVGSSLLFVKYLEGKEAAAKLLETSVFTATRALFIGALGALAALIGSAFLDLQRWFWVLLGSAYVVLGLVYLAGKHWKLMRVLGPKLNRVRTARGAATLGVIFGLNIPACAAPLLAAVFAASLGTASVAQGFWMMAVFGLALSLPLVAAVFWPRARGWLDRIAALTQRVPFWTGVVFVLLGAWSVYLGLTA